MKYTKPTGKYQYHYKVRDCFSGEYAVMHTNTRYKINECTSKGFEVLEDISRYY